MQFVTKENWKEHEDKIGVKAIRLLELMESSAGVPRLVVIPADEIARLFAQEKVVFNSSDRAQLQSELKTKTYAVRSAALLEDRQASSMAGQFMSVLDVAFVGLEKCVQEIVLQAQTKCKVGAGDFSVIIQEYSEPIKAGVLFTRNPLGTREMILEYTTGRGTKVVEGEQVERIHILPGDEKRHQSTLSFLPELLALAKQIEQRYDWPQDIEWSLAATGLQLLQTRPITTFTPDMWSEVGCIEKVLKQVKSKYYYFEKTAICESFSEPKPLALSLLKHLYRAGGPIERAYGALKVTYKSPDQFQLFGKSLFIHKDSEIKALFPSYGYTKYNSERLSLESTMGFWQSFKNTRALQQLAVDIDPALQSDLEALASQPSLRTHEIVNHLSQLDYAYSIIFGVNIRLEKALTLLKNQIQNQSDLSALVSTIGKYVDFSRYTTDDLVGNSLALDDTSKFSLSSTQAVQDDHLNDYLTAIPKQKRQRIEKNLESVLFYQDLRELGRLISVKIVTGLRNSLVQMAHMHNFTDTDLIYYGDLDDVLVGKVIEKELLTKKQNHESLSGVKHSHYIASFIKKVEGAEKTSKISPGTAEGTLVSRDTVTKVTGKKILLVDVLSPDLTEYFDNIEGIITRQGGMLSHLAIMAREAGLPVLVSKRKYSVGQEIEI